MSGAEPREALESCAVPDFLMHHPAVAIAGVVGLGVAAQVLAQRLRLPSILLLLVFGFAVSPAGLGFYQPGSMLPNDEVFFALVSAAVAVILFEGGLTLDLGELQEIGRPLRMLITVGAAISWALTTMASAMLLGLNLEVSLLLGAILVVTGPTVIGPLLRHVRPTGRVASIVKWEGILNDPVGALLAVLVLEVVLSLSKGGGAWGIIAWGVVVTIVVGLGLGLAAAWLLLFAMRKHWISDHLQGITTLAAVLAAFVASNLIQHEAGLFTVTIMGIALANQRRVPVKHIVEFKEHLGVLFISCLFIALSARFTPDKLSLLSWRSAAFLLALIFVVRPISVFVSFLGSELSWREKLFVAWMAPRGIVAAAVASLFALRLEEASIVGANILEPTMFVVIVGTVSVYGLTAGPVAVRLGVASTSRQGLLIMGAHGWARAIAKAVESQGISVLLVDTNRRYVLQAKMEGLAAHHGNVLDEGVLDKLDLSALGRFLALTSNDEANALAAMRCQEEFGRSEVYQVRIKALEATPGGTNLHAAHLRGRPLFREGATHSALTARVAAGAEVRATRLTESYGLKEFEAESGARAVPLFAIKGEVLRVFTGEEGVLAPQVGEVLVYLGEEQDRESVAERLSKSSVRVEAGEPGEARIDL